jgi:diguanylate cyclase (GGDEF)-like protein
MAGLRSGATGGLVDDLHRSFRVLLTGLVAVAVMLGAIGWLMLARLQPDVEYDTELTRGLREAHEGMIDRASALRGWLATGDEQLLLDDDEARVAVDASSRRLTELLGHDAMLDRHALEVRLAQQSWVEGWAEPTLRLVPEELTDDERQAVVVDGTERFNRYRQVQEAAVRAAVDERDKALRDQRTALATGLGLATAIALLLVVVARRSRRRIAAGVGRPIERLLTAMERVAAGLRPEVADLEGPTELRALAQGLEATSERLVRDRDALVQEQERTARAAGTLQAILDVAREIAGSLNVRYVAESVAASAGRIAKAGRVVIWLSDGAELLAVHDTTLPRGAAPGLPRTAVGEGGVGLAARDARPSPILGDHRGLALPLVVGGRVVGVLELGMLEADLDEEAQQPLETLAIHAAAALEAARLHRQAEDLAQVDALTQLYNRRALDTDLGQELARSARYGRPLACILLDLDHFKVLNDTFGHLHGDEVLRAVSETLSGTLRESDTVYRYGGEEFAVLVREGDLADALLLAERLRDEVSRVFVGEQGTAKVTASFGVAAAPQHGTTVAELLASADAALYAAKRAGRDRVEVARSRARARDRLTVERPAQTCQLGGRLSKNARMPSWPSAPTRTRLISSTRSCSDASRSSAASIAAMSRLTSRCASGPAASTSPRTRSTVSSRSAGSQTSCTSPRWNARSVSKRSPVRK